MTAYQCGSLGPEVTSIQTKLRDAGFYNGPLDGKFGGGTESAVKAFQRANGLPADGVVGDSTWAKLFGNATPVREPEIKSASLNLRCLALTGSFETDSAPPECFSGLSGDFDGQGISLGVCQWNLGQGSLQPLLIEMQKNHPAVIDDIFHDYSPEFRRMLSASPDEQLGWSRSIQNARHIVAEPWQGLLKTLARSAEFQKIQAEAANHSFQAALALCEEYNVTSERAAALLFDIKVQNGSINDVVKAQIERDFSQLPAAQTSLDREVARLQIIANRRSAAAASRWVEDVRVRKLTIANGVGTVHGRRFDLDSQYGIGLRPMR